jgi:hypothetical protein
MSRSPSLQEVEAEHGEEDREPWKRRELPGIGQVLEAFGDREAQSGLGGVPPIPRNPSTAAVRIVKPHADHRHQPVLFARNLLTARSIPVFMASAMTAQPHAPARPSSAEGTAAQPCAPYRTPLNTPADL